MGTILANPDDMKRYSYGAFSNTGVMKSYYSNIGVGGYGFQPRNLYFDSNVGSENNPIANHGSGTEIKPYNISLLPIMVA